MRRLRRPFCLPRRAHAAPNTTPRTHKTPYLRAARVGGAKPRGRSGELGRRWSRKPAPTPTAPRGRHLGPSVFGGGGESWCSWCRRGHARGVKRPERVAARVVIQAPTRQRHVRGQSHARAAPPRAFCCLCVAAAARAERLRRCARGTAAHRSAGRRYTAHARLRAAAAPLPLLRHAPQQPCALVQVCAACAHTRHAAACPLTAAFEVTRRPGALS